MCIGSVAIATHTSLVLCVGSDEAVDNGTATNGEYQHSLATGCARCCSLALLFTHAFVVVAEATQWLYPHRHLLETTLLCSVLPHTVPLLVHRLTPLHVQLLRFRWKDWDAVLRDNSLT